MQDHGNVKVNGFNFNARMIEAPIQCNTPKVTGLSDMNTCETMVIMNPMTSITKPRKNNLLQLRCSDDINKQMPTRMKNMGGTR